MEQTELKLRQSNWKHKIIRKLCQMITMQKIYSLKALLRMLLVLMQFWSSKDLLNKKSRFFINNRFQDWLVNNIIWNRCSLNNSNIYLVCMNKKSILILSSKLFSRIKSSNNSIFRIRNYQLKFIINQFNQQCKRNNILRIAKRTIKQQRQLHINLHIQIKLSTLQIC